MSSSTPTQHTWNAGRGIVFAGENRTAYHHSVTARNFTTQAAAAVPSISSLLDEAAAPVGDNKGGSAANVTSVREEAEEEVEEEVAEKIEDDDAPPPFTPLDWKIPEDKFRSTKKAEEGTPGSYWNYNLYRRPGEDGATPQTVKVHYCMTGHTTERVLQQYFAHEKVLGFDLEWDPNGWKTPRNARRNVSVVQLASESRIGIFHLALYPNKEPLATPTLRQIIEDPSVTKLGVSIKGDAQRMEKYFKMQPRGIFELSHLYKVVRYSASGEYGEINKKLVSLARQVEDVLGLPMFKGDHVRSSDWTKRLRMDQIIYGASDAYAAIQIYAVLNHQREQLDPAPPLPEHAELDKPIRLGKGIKFPPRAPRISEDELSPPPDGTTPETDAKSATKAAKKPVDPRIQEASLWAAQYRIANPDPAIPLSCLRSYYVWHKNPELDPVKIAALLRDPPLQTMTVVMYLAEVITKVKSLPCDKARIVGEILPWFKGHHLGPTGKRHAALLKLCEEAEGIRSSADETVVELETSEETAELELTAETVGLELSEESASVRVTEEMVELQSSKVTTKVKISKE
ncbi:putative Werner syndrome helicase [Cladorrhinum sp. PSN332]|nr:putative Werner syndrome helicase [Cladorrhinum sp. PSN332]